jgi:hypothetical protein
VPRTNAQFHSVAALALLSLFAATLHAEQIFTNADIVKLANSGMSEQLILSVIANEVSHFDVSPEALIELRRQGVSDRVIREMLKAAAAGRRSGSASAIAASGTVTDIDNEGGSVLHLSLGNSGPVTVTGVDCKGSCAHSGIPQGAHTIAFDLPGRVGEERDLVISPPSLPNITTTGSWHITVKLAELEQQQPQ